MSGHDQDSGGEPRDIRESTPNSTGPERAAGGMGVSSERVGHAGPGQVATDGVKDTSPVQPADDDVPPEQSPGGEEVQPDGLMPHAGYPSLDPRSADKPWKPA